MDFNTLQRFHHPKCPPRQDFSGEIDGLKKGIMNFVNRQVSRFSRIAEVRFVKEAFEKTATHKIRRMKYCTA